MPDQPLSYEIAFFRAYQRPAWVVMVLAQMILGLAVTLILKFKALELSRLVPNPSFSGRPLVSKLEHGSVAQIG